jgi:hypothetical protein
MPFVIGVGSLVRVLYVYSEPVLKRHFGRCELAESSSESKPELGPLPAEVISVSYELPAPPVDLDNLESESTTL